MLHSRETSQLYHAGLKISDLINKLKEHSTLNGAISSLDEI